MSDDMYKRIIIDRYKRPHHRGTAKSGRSGKVANQLCGDEMTINVRLEDGVIADLVWDGQGCAISQAAADLLADRLIGNTSDYARGLSEGDMVEILGVDLGPARLKCATLGLKAAKVALDSTE